MSAILGNACTGTCNNVGSSIQFVARKKGTSNPVCGSRERERHAQ
jgi:hypothetical protein